MSLRRPPSRRAVGERHAQGEGGRPLEVRQADAGAGEREAESDARGRRVDREPAADELVLDPRSAGVTGGRGPRLEPRGRRAGFAARGLRPARGRLPRGTLRLFGRGDQRPPRGLDLALPRAREEVEVEARKMVRVARENGERVRVKISTPVHVSEGEFPVIMEVMVWPR